MGFSGDVSVMSIQEVLEFVVTNALSGSLAVRGPSNSMNLFFHEGGIVVPTIPPKRKSGRIDRSALTALLDRGAKLSKSSGRLRTTNGSDAKKKKKKKSNNKRAISADVIEKILGASDDVDPRELAKRVEEALLEALRWGKARFDFAPGEMPHHARKQLKSGLALTFDVNSVLMEDARRIDDTERMSSSGISDRIVIPGQARNQRDLHGDLKGIGLAAVLQSLSTQRRSGTLTVYTSDREESLYFGHGEAFVLLREEEGGSDFARDFLGDDLVDQEHQTNTRVGLVSIDDLSEDEQRAVKDTFLDALFWDEAQFVFLKNDLPADFDEPGEKVGKIALKTRGFLMEAIQRLTEWDEVRRAVGGRSAVLDFMNFEEKMSQSKLVDPRSLSIMTLIDGNLTFDQIVNLSGLEYLEVGRVVKKLVDDGHLKVRTED